MADRQTGSVWTHYDGSILTGPLANQGLALEIEPIVHTTWSQWLETYPETSVLDWYPEFAQRYRDIDPGRGGLGPQFQATILNWDDRLPENELVLGANVGEEYRAYVLADSPGGIRVIEDTLGGISIVVFLESGNNFGLAYEAALNGQQLQFSADGDEIKDQTGTIWDISGRAVAGPQSGAQLEFVTSFVTEWYGWAAYHPGTTIWAP